MPLCAVLHCKNQVRFRFPSDANKSNAWRLAIGFKNLKGDSTGVCEMHFLPEEINNASVRLRLKSYAVPSINLESRELVSLLTFPTDAALPVARILGDEDYSDEDDVEIVDLTREGYNVDVFWIKYWDMVGRECQIIWNDRSLTISSFMSDGELISSMLLEEHLSHKKLYICPKCLLFLPDLSNVQNHAQERHQGAVYNFVVG